MQSDILLQRQIAQTTQILLELEKIRMLNEGDLRWRASESSWNILECIEHLNRYGNHYLPAIDGAIQKAKKPKEETFHPGFLGDYFAKSMLPAAQMKKIKTFKDKNPLDTDLSISVLDTCIQQQKDLLQLLEKASKVSLNKTRVTTSISAMIRLKLGDTFQFLINHILRHLKQIADIQAATSRFSR